MGRKNSAVKVRKDNRTRAVRNGTKIIVLDAHGNVVRVGERNK